MAHWTLVCADPPVRLDVDAGDNGPVSGTLVAGGTTFPVSGSWAASFSLPERHASAFSVSGAVTPAGGASTFVAAAGIMTGPGPSPTQIAIRVFISSSGDGTMTSYDVVLLPPQPPVSSPWLLNFTSPDVQSPLGDGRPWGDGTGMSQRAYDGFAPWDTGNKVVPMVGGDLTLGAMRDAFEAAITAASTRPLSSLPPGQRGHVYIADWQFNALRDLSANAQRWTSAQPGDKAQTALGLVCRMMAAGIKVRLLLWMPTSAQFGGVLGPTALAHEHWSVAAAVQDYNTALEKRFGLSQPLGVVALDLRTASPTTASLHQKMIAVRVGDVNVAFCGGVDLAFTRRDHGLAGALSVGVGDWQSGDTSPLPSWWSMMTGTDYPVYPYQGSPLTGRFTEDLPANVYGTSASGWRHWHDHHLRLEGPIVATLEQQFAERWVMDTGGRVYTFDRSSSIGTDDQVQLTSPDSWSQGKVLPLPPAKACPAAGNSTVQMWRTIPLRPGVKAGPFVRGEFTVTAGVANAVKQATQLITVWDQYFWSEPFAKQLGAQLMANQNLYLLIVLPPFGTSISKYELWYRRRALQTLAQILTQPARNRVHVMNMWSQTLGTGVYVHAKCQTYDENLLVCGSANMNRRSTECDAELDCAVLDTSVVRTHLANLYACLTGQPWTQFTPGWLHNYWTSLAANTLQTLVPDPFWAGVPNPATPKPNSVAMTCTATPEGLLEPTSIANPPINVEQPYPPLEVATCTLPGCAGDPGAEGRLDEISFMLERCRQDPNATTPSWWEWPWRQPAS